MGGVDREGGPTVNRTYYPCPNCRSPWTDVCDHMKSAGVLWWCQNCGAKDLDGRYPLGATTDEIRARIKEATTRQAEMLGIKPPHKPERRKTDVFDYVVMSRDGGPEVDVARFLIDTWSEPTPKELEWEWLSVPADWATRSCICAFCSCGDLPVTYRPTGRPACSTAKKVELHQQRMVGVGVDRVWLGQCECRKVHCGYITPRRESSP